MSLSYKLIGFFAAILTATSGVSAFIVARLGERQVEDEIRARALESGPEFNEELGKSSTFDRKTIEDKLASFLRTHSGFNAVELARVEHPGPDLDPAGHPRPERARGGAHRRRGLDPEAGDRHARRRGPDGRFWSVSQRIKVGRDPGRLTLEASLAEADALAAKESKVFGIVTIGSALLLILAGAILISLLIGRPIARMAETMAQVERGQLEVEAPLGAGKEFDRLARGFNTMLGRIRGFNQELTERIEQATADLARKNHDLAELNDLLVAARRDLTAKERLAALGQLAGTIAHELGNPLNSISGHVQLLERARGLPADVRADLETVPSEVERMTGVIRRFLDSTRGLRPAPELVDLGTLLSESLDMSLSADARAAPRGHARASSPEVAGVRHRSLARAPRGHQPGGQRGGRHARRAASCTSSRGAEGDELLRRRPRHRHRHLPRGAPPHLRAVLHDQAARARAPGWGSPSAARSPARSRAASTSRASSVGVRRSRSGCRWCAARRRALERAAPLPAKKEAA